MVPTLQPAMLVRLQNPVTDKSEEAGTVLAPGAQSGGGPQEVIFGDDNS